MATPLVYRFRPNGANPEECIMEIMMLFAKNEDGSHPPFGKATIVGVNDSWHKVPGMGSAADVTDQDTENLKRIQRGIRASTRRLSPTWRSEGMSMNAPIWAKSYPPGRAASSARMPSAPPR